MLPARVVVSGGAGFVGRNLMRELVARGVAVGGVLREYSDASVLDPAVVLLRHDGTTEDLHGIVRAFAPDCIVHLASYFVPEHRAGDVERLIRSNLLFAAQLADAAAAAEVAQFVDTGTAWQHFDGPAYNPVSLYAATKQAFDDILRYYRERFGLRVVTLKLSDTYGPGDPRKKLLPLLLDCVKTGQRLEMSAGEQRVNPVFITDVVAAYVRALELVAGLQPGEAQAYSVAGAEQPRLRELVALIEREAGATLDIAWGARPYRAREVMVPWQGPPLPGWQPRIDLATGIRHLLGNS